MPHLLMWKYSLFVCMCVRVYANTNLSFLCVCICLLMSKVAARALAEAKRVKAAEDARIKAEEAKVREL